MDTTDPALKALALWLDDAEQLLAALPTLPAEQVAARGRELEDRLRQVLPPATDAALLQATARQPAKDVAGLVGLSPSKVDARSRQASERIVTTVEMPPHVAAAARRGGARRG